MKYLRIPSLFVYFLLIQIFSAAAGEQVTLSLQNRKFEPVDSSQPDIRLTGSKNVYFKGSAETARSALSMKYKASNWNGFDCLILKIKPESELKPGSINIKLRNGKRYYELDTVRLLPDKAAMEKEKWHEIVFDLHSVPRDKNREVRIYYNRGRKMTGKVFAGEFKIILEKKSGRVKSLPLGKIRTRVFPKPYIAARAHVKYALNTNWFFDPDYYAERILLLNRNLKGVEDDKLGVGGKDNFARTVELMKQSGADGIAMLNIDISQSYLNRTLNGIKYADKLGMKAVIVPEISIFSRGTGEEYLDRQIKNAGTRFLGADALIDRLFSAAIASDSTFKFKGKTLISSYSACVLPADFWKSYLAKCREKQGDRILFMAELRKIFYSAARRYNKNGGLSKRELDEIRTYLNSYLKVCDGILFAGQNHIVKPPNTNRFYHEFYHGIIIPLLNELMNQPQNKGKLLGLGISKGYANHLAGQLQSEEGTRVLRSIIEYASKINPDYIVLVEWNEIKERTNLEPTVNDGRSSMRILRYYFSMLKGEENTPLPGDNLKVPNMILSYRPQVVPGEKMDFELLNVPDSASGKFKNCRVKLELLDLDGKVVESFPERKITGRGISDIRFTAYADSKLAPRFILLPRVAVTDDKGNVQVFDKGFPYINISASEVIDYKYFKVPFRDLPQTEQYSFIAERKGNSAAVKASISDEDRIAFIEVLRNRRPVYSAVSDPDYILKPNQYLIKVSWNAWTEAKPLYPSIDLTLDKGTIHRVRYSNRGWGNGAALGRPSPGKLKLRLVNLTHGARRGVYLVIDNTSTQMTVTCGDYNKTISLDELRENGVYRAMPGDGMNIVIEDFKRIPDLPPHVNKRSYAFSTVIDDIAPRDILCMRYITKEGRIFRSKPLTFMNYHKTRTIAVWNDKTGVPGTQKVSSSAVMPIEYKFDPSCGAILKAPGFDSRYYAQLGGSTNYGGPFFNRDSFPKGQSSLNPEWQQDPDGKYILSFNGKGNHLVIPLYATPAMAFSYVIEMKPESEEPQLLLRSCSKTGGALMVIMEKGFLKFRFVTHDLKTIEFSTPPIINYKKWNKLTIAFDHSFLRVKVDDGKVLSYPCQGKPQKVTQMVFGGLGKGKRLKYYKGYLKSLMIVPYSILLN